MNQSIYNKTESPLVYKSARKIADYRVQYPGQSKFQRAYFELTEASDIICPTYDGEIGGAIPFSVYYGRDRRYYFSPQLKMRDVNQLGRDILPLLERVRAGISMRWDGNNYIATLTDDAKRAEAEIEAMIEDVYFSNL